MKRVLLLPIALAAIAAGIIVAIVSTHSASSAPGGPPDISLGPAVLGRVPLVTECFLMEDGDNPNEAVRLTTDNFGGDVVTVINGVFMCEGARKQRIGTAATLPLGSPGRFVYECYRVLEGADPADPVTLRTLNFGDQKVKVGRAVAMCESARKRHVAADGSVSVTGAVRQSVWECYEISADTTTNIPVTLETSNFGVDTVRTGRPILMCEEAQKHTADPAQHDIGQASGLVWECFLLDTPIQRSAPVTLTTYNFGQDDVTVRNPFIMCERARKIVSLTFFPVTVVPTGTPTPATFPPTPTETELPDRTQTPVGG